MVSARQSQQNRRNRVMAPRQTPKFHNDMGVPAIDIGAREFECTGALPPFDHPHIYIDMGDEAETVCPYCSTLFRYDPALPPDGARPSEAVLHDDSHA
jgi:uncharacterized Zn-finger protein